MYTSETRMSESIFDAFKKRKYIEREAKRVSLSTFYTKVSMIFYSFKALIFNVKYCILCLSL